MAKKGSQGQTVPNYGTIRHNKAFAAGELLLPVAIPRLEMENIEAVIPLRVGKDGRVSGLTQFAGLQVFVVVPADAKPLRGSRRGDNG